MTRLLDDIKKTNNRSLKNTTRQGNFSRLKFLHDKTKTFSRKDFKITKAKDFT